MMMMMVMMQDTLSNNNMLGLVEELLYRLRSWSFGNDLYTCVHSVYMGGGEWRFRKLTYDFYFFTYQPEILHTPRGRQ